MTPWWISIAATMLALFAYAKGKMAICVLAFTILLGSGVMSLRQMALTNSIAQNLIGTVSTIQFQVSTDPMQTQAKAFGTSQTPPNYSFLATALTVESEGKKYRLRVPIRVMTTDREITAILPGQVISSSGTLIKSREARVAGLFILREKLTISTPASRWARTLGAIRADFRTLMRSDDAGALIPGMVLGDTSLQSQQLRDDMRRSGLTHLVAVSGANFAIISLFALWCMQWFFRSLRIRLILTSLVLASFIALVRPSPSVLRAAAMASVVLVARGIGKRSDAIPALGFAMAAVVVGDPWQARDPGFALSVLATAGLLLLAPRIATWFGRFFPPWLSNALSPATAAVLMCAPVLVALSGYLGLMTVFANLLVAPVVAPITILGFIAALCSPVLPEASSVLLLLVRYPSEWIVGVAHWAARFPVLQISTGVGGFIGGLAVLLFLAALVLLWRSHRMMIVLSVSIILFLTWNSQWPRGDWQLANCNVGQGDSLVINLGNHRGFVIDAGPDATLEDRCLTQLGIRSIPLLVLTHFHADHVEGLAGLMRSRSVGQIWVSNNKDPLFESSRVRKWLGDRQLVEPKKGAIFSLPSSRGLITIKVLWPLNSSETTAVGSAVGSVINNSSVVLDITGPDFSLLAAGDVEPEAQTEILPSLRHVDIYKVSHHGSARQVKAFMERLSPDLSIISVGQGNPYGHPAAQTLATLDRLRSRIYRTDKNGAIAIVARSHRLTVHTSAGSWWQKVRLA
ncbi:MAG: ComEC/Rec2 family competence protein [Candidatus Nanopelagicaceae bacterium]|nr:ComEC/Rec2 family competence protein [Candidatus Nanopelagicaceae bacterium]